MKNYVVINGQKIELTEEQAAQIKASFTQQSVELSEVAAGNTVKIGNHEMVILEHVGAETLLIRKEPLPEDIQFGESNNYDGSFADDACNEFAEEIVSVVGEGNLLLHTVDLTSDDGLKDYGEVQRRASLLTAELYRRYVEILDKHKPNKWWWLSTAHSTPAHSNDSWVKCVSPSGFIDNDYCSNNYRGVRPFCILKSNIFVSK